MSKGRKAEEGGKPDVAAKAKVKLSGKKRRLEMHAAAGREPKAPIKAKATETKATKVKAADIQPAKGKTAKLKKEDTSPFGEDKLLLISKAIADPRRFTILRMVARGVASCNDVRQCLPISAATLSHHMRELERAGLIQTSREGRFMQARLQRKVWKSYLGELKALAE